jgi:hypothetical protein
VSPSDCLIEAAEQRLKTITIDAGARSWIAVRFAIPSCRRLRRLAVTDAIGDAQLAAIWARTRSRCGTRQRKSFVYLSSVNDATAV